MAEPGSLDTNSPLMQQFSQARLRWRARRGWEHFGIAGLGVEEKGIVVFASDERGREGARHLFDAPALTYSLIETGRIVACSRPAQGGDSISTASGLTGTFGCVVKNDQGHPFILSCNHVLADLNKATKRVTEIWQPGRGAGGRARDRIGVLYDFATLHIGGTTANSLDAALCEPDNPRDVINGLRIAGVDHHPSLNTDVQKTGWKTQTTQGILSMLHTSFIMEIQSQDILMEEQFGLLGASSVIFAEEGDSGAMVLNQNDHVLGMIIASASAHNLAFATSIGEVTRYFNVSIP